MTINHLIMLGENGFIGNEKFSNEFLYSLPKNPNVKSLSFVDLENLIKGLAILESSRDYGFGSTTVIHKLLKLLKIKKNNNKEKKINDLINHLFKNRTNPYIPFGCSVPLEVRSIKEYEEYEYKRQKHREEMEIETKKVSKLAKEKKLNNIKTHHKRKKENTNKRNEILNKTKKLNTLNRFKWIIEHNYSINIYPDDYADISSDELDKISRDILLKLLYKLKYAKRKSKWEILKSVISSYLKIEKNGNLIKPNYIVCPECENILDLNYKDSFCPNPNCGFRFKGLNKYLNKDIEDLRKEFVFAVSKNDEHLKKIIEISLRYNSGIYLTYLINNFNNKKYRKEHEKFVLMFLKDVDIIKNALILSDIKNTDNVLISKNGFKIFPELLDLLYLNSNQKIKDFLKHEFKSFYKKSKVKRREQIKMFNK